MGKIRKYNSVKLIFGFIYHDEAIFIQARNKLKKIFGKIDFESPALDFNCTDYYQPEMGADLKKKFVSFSRLIPMGEFYRIKLYTNRLESKFLNGPQRRINIDPGYLDKAKFVLASTKDYAHRIYLHKGIFAEVALSYRNNSFSPNAWSYPDYRSKEYLDIFNQIRARYAP